MANCCAVTDRMSQADGVPNLSSCLLVPSPAWNPHDIWLTLTCAADISTEQLENRADPATMQRSGTPTAATCSAVPAWSGRLYWGRGGCTSSLGLLLALLLLLLLLPNKLLLEQSAGRVGAVGGNHSMLSTTGPKALGLSPGDLLLLLLLLLAAVLLLLLQLVPHAGSVA